MKAQNITATKALIRVFAILILAVGFLTITATAQNRRGGFAPIGDFTGVESSPGTPEPISGNNFGNTLVLDSSGEWETQTLTVSLDYSTNQYVPYNFTVTGGSWSVVVLREGIYMGTVYGSISSGSVRVAPDSRGNPSQTTQLSLTVMGGLGTFEGIKIRDIRGFLNLSTDLRSKQAQGRIDLNF